MSQPLTAPLLTVDGLVGKPLALSFADLAVLPAEAQIADVSQLDPQRRGVAVRLDAILDLAAADKDAQYLTLHATADDFHASIPLAAVRERAVLIYQLEGQPLPVKSGGPLRFLIPQFAACHTAEIDECANVKFVDRIELSQERGHDNRPLEDAAHEELHRKQSQSNNP